MSNSTDTPCVQSPPAAPRRLVRRALRFVWLRGFLPVVFTALLWIFSMGGQVIWQGTATYEPRAVLGKGVVGVCWNSKSQWQGIGRVRWSLGTNFTVNGKRVVWYVGHPLWSPSKLEAQRYTIIKPGNVQIPLFYLVAASLIFPLMSWIVRRRYCPPWACRGCRYDLRGTTGAKCPECGRGKDVPATSQLCTIVRWPLSCEAE